MPKEEPINLRQRIAKPKLEVLNEWLDCMKALAEMLISPVVVKSGDASRSTVIDSGRYGVLV